MMSERITYQEEPGLGVQEFIEVLEASTLAKRRPVSDRLCIEGMLAHADLIITARDATRLVRVARSVTDFHYCCYLADLAVDDRCQHQGIGTRLIRDTQDRLRPTCRLLLLSAPAAVDYYRKVGFERHPQAWTLPRGRTVRRS
ncbi:MAG: GNAT family N-acetyltransferase [Vicinamibacterales bacterium]|jgi:predicted N-acetyltransferase YhbS|nr:GNAT family N-acetyltransferase [Vicinamibacterales bacterium]MDP7480484.1 GNAT family N-acetyltransferase [Vicinamibacterales bacterium]HJN45896.1 GNAT family N-acetyltransferase [Vicinamibacterales bacterium]|tara:strand:- start:282 stop:710 length:429 start_codon:yes stop_codon:yes gene_type:complete